MTQLQSQLPLDLDYSEPAAELPSWTDKLPLLVPYEGSDHHTPEPLPDGWDVYLREAFHADLEVGKLFWREDRPREHFTSDRGYHMWLTRFGGREAGTLNSGNGRWMIKITFKGKYRCLRRSHLMFFFAKGEWPTSIVDHINHDEADDRAINLRLRSTRGNQHNRIDQSSFGIGVQPSGKGYLTLIYIEDRHFGIGSYRTIEAAQAAYDLAFMLLTPDAQMGPNGTRRVDWAEVELLARQERLIAPSPEKRSGYRGVGWQRSSSKWQVQAWHEGRNNHLGLYSDPLEALSILNAFWLSVNRPEKVQQPQPDTNQ